MIYEKTLRIEKRFPVLSLPWLSYRTACLESRVFPDIKKFELFRAESLPWNNRHIGEDGTVVLLE
jgi:hypothetical protein